MPTILAPEPAPSLVAAEKIPDAEDIEITLLLEGVYRRYGYDFRDYARASIRRRILSRVEAEGLPSISALQGLILRDPAAMHELLRALTVHVTAMFRDPSFYKALRERIVSLLATYPFVRIWHAGCSSGEEVYSMSILLHEEGLYDRCRIYATDLSEQVLKSARNGIYPLAAMREYTQNYWASGGRHEFSEYYTASSQSAVLRSYLRRNVIFAQHDLATEAAFNEFHLIMCRNVMIYFNKSLQERVTRLLDQSLVRLGILVLGQRESLADDVAGDFEAVDPRERIFRKVGAWSLQGR